MNEGSFSYRIVFFVNGGGKDTKHHIDTSFSGLRKSLEGIVRSNLSLTSTVSVAQTTVLKDGGCIRLQSRAYKFSLEGYFSHLAGTGRDGIRKGNITYGRCAAR